MTTAAKTQTERLAELRQAVVAAEVRVAELERRAQEAPRAYERALAELRSVQEAIGRGDREDDRKAEAELERAVATAREGLDFRPIEGPAISEGTRAIVGEQAFDPRAEALLAGAREALDERRAAVEAFQVGNYELAEEWIAEGSEATKAAQETWDRLQEQLKGWSEIRNRWPAFMEVNGKGSRTLPADPFHALTFVEQVDPRWPHPDPRRSGIPLPAPRSILRRRERGEDVFDDAP
jgi:hypothetical protein